MIYLISLFYREHNKCGCTFVSFVPETSDLPGHLLNDHNM